MGNRFNILRFNGAGVYFLYVMLLHFFGKNELHNKRLEAVHWDLNVLTYRVCCRALGLIGNKNTLTGLANCKTQVDIMPIYLYVQNQGKPIVQSRENDQKTLICAIF